MIAKETAANKLLKFQVPSSRFQVKWRIQPGTWNLELGTKKVFII